MPAPPAGITVIRQRGRVQPNGKRTPSTRYEVRAYDPLAGRTVYVNRYGTLQEARIAQHDLRLGARKAEPSDPASATYTPPVRAHT